LVDVTGEPAASVAYRVRTPAGKDLDGRVLWGGTVRLQGIASGACTVSFPSFDEGAHDPELHPGDQIPKPATKPCQRSGADKAYKPGSPLQLATHARHKVELPLRPSYWLTVPKARKKTRQDQVIRYTLASADGAYQVTRAIKDHIRRARDASVLEFPGIDPDGKYSLYAIIGSGQKFPLFMARRWSEIQTAVAPPKQAKRKRPATAPSPRDAYVGRPRGARVRAADEELFDPEGEDGAE
jgi:hypothetical protein